jgi:Enoyl-(Acyl carrier protein) reductase
MRRRAPGTSETGNKRTPPRSHPAQAAALPSALEAGRWQRFEEHALLLVLRQEPALLHGINNAALLHMTGFLAADLAVNKVTVNAVVPGLVGTEFRQTWAKELGERQGKSTEEFVGEFCKSKGILLERWAEVSEIGDLVVFLASDRASYITGAKIPIDGGFSINSR